MLFLVALFRFGVFFEVAAVQAHVPVEGRHVFKFALTQIAFDRTGGNHWWSSIGGAAIVRCANGGCCGIVAGV